MQKENGKYFVITLKKKISQLFVSEFAKKVEDYGAEILINSVDRDGRGFDIELINLLEKNTNLPIIACG